jgi:HEAT repeat protein
MPPFPRFTTTLSRFSIIILFLQAICLSSLHASVLPHASAYLQSSSEKDSEIARLADQLRTADPEGRREAAMGLSHFREKAVTSILVGALSDSSPTVRAAVVTALGHIGDSSVVTSLTPLLAADKEVFVRKAVAYALGRLSGSTSTTALLAGLKDKDPEVRGASAVSLGEHGDPATTVPLTSALSDKNPFVRARAAAALGSIGAAAASAVPTLIALLKSDEDAEVKRQIATALGSIGDRSALPALHTAAANGDPYLSSAARDSIKKLKREDR